VFSQIVGVDVRWATRGITNVTVILKAALLFKVIVAIMNLM
jgi:hypothetical protein